MSNKPTKDAVSLVIKNLDGRVLFARRSPSKREFPGVWSLPSAFVLGDEGQLDAVKRIGEEKLGVTLRLGQMIIEGKKERDGFILFMHNYEAKILEGIPNVVSDDYTELKWEEPNVQFAKMKSGDMGMCMTLLKQHYAKRN
ncbi:MAG TPA: NUDIX domain-containing protein [Candidatus Paceibacterota bacterium]